MPFIVEIFTDDESRSAWLGVSGRKIGTVSDPSGALIFESNSEAFEAASEYAVANRSSVVGHRVRDQGAIP